MFKPAINNKVISVIGGLLFLALLSSAWFPRNCPILKDYLIGCTSYPILNEPKTETEKELSRFPHQTVRSSASFSARAEESRTNTTINFNYYLTRPENTISYLQIKETGQFKNVALVTHPLLLDLAWPTISEPNGIYLYQRNSDQNSVQAFLTTDYLSAKVAVDQVAAETLSLKPNQFTNLDQLISTDEVDYIITSRPPTIRDGKWYFFSRKFDLSTATISDQNKIEGMIVPFQANTDQAFYLTEIHIDYAKRN